MRLLFPGKRPEPLRIPKRDPCGPWPTSAAITGALSRLRGAGALLPGCHSTVQMHLAARKACFRDINQLLVILFCARSVSDGAGPVRGKGKTRRALTGGTREIAGDHFPRRRCPGVICCPPTGRAPRLRRSGVRSCGRGRSGQGRSRERTGGIARDFSGALAVASLRAHWHTRQ